MFEKYLEFEVVEYNMGVPHWVLRALDPGFWYRYLLQKNANDSSHENQLASMSD